MKFKDDKKQPCLDEIMITLEKTKFHGNITIHYTNGVARKIEFKSFQELPVNTIEGNDRGPVISPNIYAISQRT